MCGAEDTFGRNEAESIVSKGTTMNERETRTMQVGGGVGGWETQEFCGWVGEKGSCGCESHEFCGWARQDFC